MKTDNKWQKSTKQDERFKEGKQKIDNIQMKIDNIYLKTHKIVVNLLKSFRIDKEPIRINTS